MYCTTCGAVIPSGQAHCGVCGTRAPASYAPRATAPSPYAPAPYTPLHAHGHAQPYPQLDGLPVGLCPRCMYQGTAAGYFSTGGNLAKLIFLTLLTAGAMGVGGLLYFVVRKDHRVCPRCGEKWGTHGQRAVALAASSGRAPAVAGAMHAGIPATQSESSFSFGSVAMYVMALIFLVVGIAELELVPFLFGAGFAGGGFAVQQKQGRDRERRREMLVAQLQQPVLQLAGERGGRLTVTEVASAFGWPMPRAEKILNSLDDGMRVTSDVTDEGVIVYQFRELMHTRSALPPRTA